MATTITRLSHILFFISTILLLSCETHSYLKSSKPIAANPDYRIVYYEELKGLAVCSCVLESYKRDSVDTKDISLVIYNNVLSESYVDTILSMGKRQGSKIRGETYKEYGGKKASLYRCNQWVTSDSMQKILKGFARSLQRQPPSSF